MNAELKAVASSSLLDYDDDDATLIMKARGTGEAREDAYRELFRRYKHELVQGARQAQAHVLSHDPEDSIVNGYYGLVKAVESFDLTKGHRFGTWVRVKARRAGDCRTREQQRLEGYRTSPFVGIGVNGDADTVELADIESVKFDAQRDVRADIHQALNKLDASVRAVLLERLNGKALDELATQCDQTPEALTQSLESAYARLREELREHAPIQGVPEEDASTTKQERVTALIMRHFKPGAPFTVQQLWEHGAYYLSEEQCATGVNGLRARLSKLVQQFAHTGKLSLYEGKMGVYYWTEQRLAPSTKAVLAVLEDVWEPCGIYTIHDVYDVMGELRTLKLVSDKLTCWKSSLRTVVQCLVRGGKLIREGKFYRFPKRLEPRPE